MAVDAGFTNNSGTRHAYAFAESVKNSGRLNELTLMPKSFGLLNFGAQLASLPSAFNMLRAGKLPPIQLTTSGQGANVGPLIEAIVQMWKQNLGVDVTIQQEETATFFEDARQGKLQMYTEAWAADYPDPEDFLSVNFLSDSQQNEAKYSNPQVDEQLKTADTSLDESKRMDLYHQAEQQILSDAPWIPLTWDKDAFLVKPYVKGYEPVGLIIPLLRYVSIQK